MKKTAFLISILLAFVSLSMIAQEATPAKQQDSEKIDPKLGQAFSLMKQGKNQEAEKLFSELILEKPENAQIFFLYAQNQIAQKKLDEAMKIAEQGLEKNETHIGLLKVKALIFASKRETGDAIDVLEEVTEMYATDVEAWLMLSAQYLQDGEWGDSIDAAEKVLELQPKNAVAYNNIGWAYIGKKKYEKSIKNFEKALELDKTFKPAIRGKMMAEGMEKRKKAGRRAPEINSGDRPINK